MKLEKSRSPTLIGHDIGTCEFSPHLQLFGWQFEVGFNNVVISLTDDVDISLTDDVDISLTYIENEMKQF